MGSLRTAVSAVRFETLERRQLFAATLGPDVTFAEGGTARVAVRDIVDIASDGKITVATTSILPSLEFDDLREGEILTRLNADGTTDATFGTNGQVILDGGFRSSVTRVGGLLFATLNTRRIGGGTDRLEAYTLDGTPAAIFKGNHTSVDLPYLGPFPTEPKHVDAGGLLRAPDGGLLSIVDVTVADGTVVTQIVKLRANGSVDTSFGRQGVLSFPAGTPPRDTFVGAGGLYLRNTDDVVTRYTLNGKAIDTSYGTQGVVRLPDDAGTPVEQADGKLLFIAPAPGGLRLQRLNANGSIDTAFGNGGSAALSADAALVGASAHVLLDSQQRIVVETGGALFRFSPAGVIDSAPYDGTSSVVAQTIAIDAQDRVVTADSYRGVTRYDKIDTLQFGRNGKLYVTGNGDLPDQVILGSERGKLRVSVNGVVTRVNPGVVKGVVVYLGGNDNFLSASALGIGVEVTGGAGNDTIVTGSGDDIINAGAGDNVISIGDGNDTVRMSNTPSRPVSNPHLVTITGGNGNKDIGIIYGVSATVNLGVGDSKINVAGYYDQYYTNTIHIAGGNNTVRLGYGDDILTIGGNGINTVTGGSFDPAHPDSVTLGDGPDIVQIYGSGTFNTGGGNDSVKMLVFEDRGPVTVNAGAGDDRIVPNSQYTAPATLNGGDGNDCLVGSAGTQTIYGDAGRDTLHGGDGADLLKGGGGSDVIVGDGGADRLYGGAGDDALDGAGGSDQLFGEDGRDALYSGPGDDRLFGGASADSLYAQSGNDQLFGDGGNDRLYADYAAGLTTLHGGAGDDLFVTADTRLDYLFGGSGKDTAHLDAPDPHDSIEILV